MGNLKEIRTRITSIESTQKITSSMKLVSAAKLRRAQTAIQHLRPYSQKLNEILAKHTGRTLEEINKATAFDNYMSAEEAVEFGICDAIGSIY